jgi:L-cysteine S-thiosulfotransferase
MTASAGRASRSRHLRERRTARARTGILALVFLGAGAVDVARAADPGASAVVPYRVVADGIPEPLGGAPGDAARGRALVIAREPANCVLCHALPESALAFAGDLGPSLAGVGTRLSASQLRLRVVDSRRINAATIMPGYYVIDGFALVAPEYRGKSILTERQLEDVVAYLGTLR